MTRDIRETVHHLDVTVTRVGVASAQPHNTNTPKQQTSYTLSHLLSNHRMPRINMCARRRHISLWRISAVHPQLLRCDGPTRVDVGVDRTAGGCGGSTAW
jgi:hypothetical protein